MSSVTADPLVQTALIASQAPRPSLLKAVLEAQQSSAKLLAGERIADSARLLVDFAAGCGSPVLSPTSPMAARLVGAALVLGQGAVRATDESTVPVGEHPLLVEAVAVGGAGLLSARERMLRLGATRVDMVALHLPSGAAGDVQVLMPRVQHLHLAARHG